MQAPWAWELLAQLKQRIIDQVGEVEDNAIKIGQNVTIHPTAIIEGPVIIGDNCTIGVGAYIRPYCIIGDNCTIGHATEIKHCILGNNVVLPHYNYVGDSVLEDNVHLGGGAVIANFRSDGKTITVTIGNEKYDTGLRKFGASIGSNVEIGAGAILNPGTIIEENCTIYPGAIIRNYIPVNSIVKVRIEQEIVQKQ